MSDTTKRRPEDEEIKRRVLEQLDALDAEGKRKVLDFSRELSARETPEVRQPRPVGDTGGTLLAFAGTISAEDLEEIRRAVEEDCEKIVREGGDDHVRVHQEARPARAFVYHPSS